MKKSLLKSIGLCLLMGSLVIFTGCSDDDPDIDTGGGGINVGNGLYLASVGSDPSGSALLSAETVEDESFASQDRSGFVGGYVYLEAGDYNVVQVTDKEITATIGGGSSEVVVDSAGSACGYAEYTVVSTVADGDPISVATSGLYRVTHDQMTNELVMYQIQEPTLIGEATPGGWATDTRFMTGSVTATGGTWEEEGVVLRNGQWKLRFNCRWSIDRRIDAAGGFDPSNGYQLFTNFGGTASNLTPGNNDGNIEQTEEGTYTVTIEWSPRNGWTINLLRTGDAPTLTFDPNDFKWGVIGDATANAWDSERLFLYKKDGDNHNWYGVATLADMGQFKFRADPDWNTNIGGALMPDGVATTLDKGGDNIDSPGAGDYYFIISTADEGATWQVTMSEMGWSVIGEGSPSGSWDTDTFLDAQPFANGISTYTLTGDFTTSGWKFRAGGDWPLNVGGNLGGLVLDGNNVELSEAGTYAITLSFDGAIWSATAEKQ